MKFLYVIALSLVFVQPVYAHINELSIFKINDLYTLVTPTTGEVDYEGEFEDRAPEWYEVGNPISFELETGLLPNPQEMLEKTTFIWDFGDGTSPESLVRGIANKHTYAKEGSYHLKITADFAAAGFPEIPPQVIQEIRIHVLKPTPAKMVTEFSVSSTTEPKKNVTPFENLFIIPIFLLGIGIIVLIMQHRF